MDKELRDKVLGRLLLAVVLTGPLLFILAWELFKWLLNYG